MKAENYNSPEIDEMEKFIEVNGNWLFSDEHFLLTERGWLKAKELQNGDKVIGETGAVGN
jgi:hypothetical protein